MFESQTASPAPSSFHHQANTMFPKFLDSSFNNNRTNFGCGSCSGSGSSSTPKPKFLDGSFNGNTTNFGSPKPKFIDGWFSNNKTNFGGGARR
jgi:hypothetical protein